MKIALPFVKNATDIIRIVWEVDGCSGATICPAWRGQHEIDGLTRAGYKIIRVMLDN